MRLPFLQLESDLLAHAASQVGVLAGCTPVQALGHIAFLRAWAVAQANDEAPPDGWARGPDAADAIESAAQWGGEAGRLLRALKVAKLVLVTPEGVQVLGLEPYRTAWEKNQKAKARMDRFRARNANVRVTNSEHAQTNAESSHTEDVRSAKFGGQTQTQTQKEPASQGPTTVVPPAEDLPDATDDAQPVAPAANGCPDCTSIVACWKHLPRDKPGEPKKRERTPSEAQLVYARMQSERAQRCEAAGEEFVEDRWDVPRINRDIGAVLKGGDEAQTRFGLAWDAFLADDARAAQGWSLSYFMKGAVRSMYENRGLKAGAA